MSKPPARNGAPQRRPGEEDGELHAQLQSLNISQTPTDPSSFPPDICPVCKSNRYLNPSMRFLVNPECYHKMCESCVDRIFSQGPAPCPVAGCARTLRKQRFRKQTFEDLQVEREVDVRRRVAAIFNRRESEFNTLLDYNNYLEEVETLTFNLLYNIDVATTEAKLAAYSKQNATDIANNKALSAQESASTEAQLAAQKEQARLRREAARNEEEEERREREEGRREIIDKIANSIEDPDKIAREGQKVVLKKSTARRNAADRLRAQDAASVDNASAPLFQIAGLKPVTQTEPDKAYDPLGGYVIRPTYFTLQEQYEHPWLEKAKMDAQIAAGGYDVGEYCARAMMEAFAGLGCFIEDEVAGRERAAGADVGTAAAAVAGGDGEGIGDDML